MKHKISKIWREISGMKKLFLVGIVLLSMGMTCGAFAKSLDDYTYEITDLNFQKKYQAALNLANVAISGYPNSAELYFLRGMCYDDLNNKKAALADFDKAISLNSKYDDAYLYRGMVKLDLNSPQSAYVDFTTCIRLNPENGNCYVGRGTVRATLGDLGGATKDMEYGLVLIEKDAEKLHKETDELIKEADKLMEELK